MGQTLARNKASPSLNVEDLFYLLTHTHFNETEIRRLFEHFKVISGLLQKADTIELNEWTAALGNKDSVFANRFFQVFDEDKNSHIDFKEFCMGLSTFCERGSVDEKIEFSFKIYDIDDDGFIDKEELYSLLKASLFENSWLQLSEDQMRGVIDNTFAEVDVNGKGKISFEEYKEMINKHPSIIDKLTVSTRILDI
eukprot:CAMPEP_0174250392 /NCGR_PEP_ID=MMETSP0439-20130205/579_1 /TAXON_ID=0 /ORGANISM="Stereomyxa ramosa, Strain Chinc5" /LENGTH=195 /DNA_ID=CAMNT_0015330447 /DNA_START=51 /DNA_END=638 /DNA_ORIENTATION=+